MNNMNYQLVELNTLYNKIKLGNQQGKLYFGRDLKLRQLEDYKRQMDAVLRKISKKNKIHLVESCAGNCYLTFYLAWHYHQEFPGVIRFSCIDRNERLINEAEQTAKDLGIDNIDFYVGNVEDIRLSTTAQVVYSLHACDTATDATLALGIQNDARYILSVSCCQFSARKKLKGHPLTGITEFAVFKERLSEMAADSMRAHLLTQFGYRPDLFVFTAPKNTGKNVMLRAERTPLGPKKIEHAQKEYSRIRDLLGFEPELGRTVTIESYENRLKGA